VLPAEFANDAERLARFKREAQVLASLNHLNIAAIHGFEASGETQALVLQFVDGETLADCIARGAIAVDEALPIARQICDALAAAHTSRVSSTAT
jgi:serine/threonine protein kinase